MNVCDCPNDDLLRRFADSKLDPQDSSIIEKHLVVCSPCLKSLDTLVIANSSTLRGKKCNVGSSVDRSSELLQWNGSIDERKISLFSAQSQALIADSPVNGNLLSYGDLIGEYVVVGVLGMGGMGVVYQAEDLVLVRQVAVKVLRPSLASNASAIERLYREARAVAAIDHPNIVPLFHIGQHQGTPFLVMPLLQGETLKMRLARDPKLSTLESLHIACEIAKGLARAHRLGIVHRDIRPDNIWLELESRQVRILDFGLASVAFDLGELTEAGAVLGSPRYMSPEQARGQPVGSASDLFSLGSVLYHMLAGTTPFPIGDNIPSILRAIVDDEPLPLVGVHHNVSKKVESFVLQLLNKNPLKRPGSAMEVATILLDQMKSQTSLQSWVPAQSSPPENNKDWRFSTVATRTGFFDRVVTRWRRLKNGSQVSLCLVALLVLLSVWRLSDVTARSRSSLNSSMFSAARSVDSKRFEEPRDSQIVLCKTALPSTARISNWNALPDDAPAHATIPFSTQEAIAHQKAWADFLDVPQTWTNSVGVVFTLIPPGDLEIGMTHEEAARILEVGRKDEKWVALCKNSAPAIRVTVPAPYYLSIHEITQRQYEAVIGKNPSHHSSNGSGAERMAGYETGNHPVENVTWAQASDFCNELSKCEGISGFYGHQAGQLRIQGGHGNGYRLPSEVEWEWGSRAGTKTLRYFDESDSTLAEHAWNIKTSNVPRAIGQLRSNAFGLFDMYGNVSEWCDDSMVSPPQSGFPRLPSLRPLRGFHVRDNSETICSGFRHFAAADYCWSLVGMRIAISIPTSNLPFNVSQSEAGK